MPIEAPFARPTVTHLMCIGQRVVRQLSCSFGLFGFPCHDLDWSSRGVFVPQNDDGPFRPLRTSLIRFSLPATEMADRNACTGWEARREKVGFQCSSKTHLWHLGPPVVPFYPFLGEGSPTKRYRVFTHPQVEVVFTPANMVRPPSQEHPLSAAHTHARQMVRTPAQAHPLGTAHTHANWQAHPLKCTRSALRTRMSYGKNTR